MPMKTSDLITKFAMGVLLFGILIYFGVYIYLSFTDGLTTVRAYEDTAYVGIKATGLVVRQERVLTAASSATIDFAPDEGEKVSGGGVVATIYASTAGLETKKAIQTLEAELEQLSYAKSAAAGISDAAKTENDLLSAMARLHASASAGDLTGLEQDALRLRALVFKRDYAYSGSTQELDALISKKSEQLNALRTSLGVASTVIRAPESGIFSAVADGYEELLSPGLLEDLTCVQLTGLENRSVAPPANAIGKIITSSSWYFAASASTASVKDLAEGGQYTISFTRDYAGQALMTLERKGDDEGGRTLLVFSCRSRLADTTLLRRQTSEIITQDITGIRIPRSSLRALKQTVKRTVTKEDGTKQTVEEEVTVTGVYTVVSRQAEFHPVTVLYQGEDYFLVAPADPDAADRLRTGDEILVYTAGITDGKVVR